MLGEQARIAIALAPLNAARLAGVLKHIPSTVYVFVGVAVIIYLWTTVIGRRRPSIINFVKFAFPREIWVTSSTKVDIGIFILSKFTQRAIALLAAFLVSALVAGLVDLLRSSVSLPNPFQPSLLNVGLCGFLVFVASDFGEFLSHYLQHRIPILWEFHKVHHSARVLTPLTTQRFHPIGNLIDTLFITGCMVPPVMLAQIVFNITVVQIFSVDGALEFACAILLLKQLQHSHFRIQFGPFERVVISPLMHQVHHSTKKEHWDKNFGSRLSIWDWWFGTAFILPRDEPLEFGIGTLEDARRDYASIVACYVRPLTQSAKIIRERFFARLTRRRVEV
jgi:sterol desaturase/sphingolipid hydroxylase (fatty acid hydroxylase superfamily)